MKLDSVDLQPRGSLNIVTLSFRDPGAENPYNVKGITGLDVEQVIPRYYKGSGSAAKFYSMDREKRVVVVRVGLNPQFSNNETYSSLRDGLYKLISSSRSGILDLKFKKAGVVIASIGGFVSKIEAPNFEKSQEVSITIDCDDAMLRAPVAVNIDVSNLNTISTTITDSLSSAPHGFSFQIAVLGPRPYFSIKDPNDSSWGFVVQPTTGILEDDILYFSSEQNNKQLYIIRGVEIIQIADGILSGSVWPILFPGANQFFIEDSESFDWLSISHYPSYWGV